MPLWNIYKVVHVWWRFRSVLVLVKQVHLTLILKKTWAKAGNCSLRQMLLLYLYVPRWYISLFNKFWGLPPIWHFILHSFMLIYQQWTLDFTFYWAKVTACNFLWNLPLTNLPMFLNIQRCYTLNNIKQQDKEHLWQRLEIDMIYICAGMDCSKYPTKHQLWIHWASETPSKEENIFLAPVFACRPLAWCSATLLILSGTELWYVWCYRGNHAIIQ